MDNPAFDNRTLEFERNNSFIVKELKEKENEIHKEENEINEFEDKEALLYGVEDVPPWYMCLFLGFQHYLEMIGATIACPFFLTPALCMVDDDPNKANIISTLVFMSGLITLLQSTFGTRLPIVQGGSFSYLIPSLAIMGLPKWACPDQDIMATLSEEEKVELWQVRMREIQGAIICAALFETLFAFTGIIGSVLKYITPLTVAPAITLIGISLFRQAAKECSKNFYVSIGTLLLLVIFSQHLRNIKLPIAFGKKTEETNEKNDKERKKQDGFPIFQVFPVLMSLALVWTICGILTATDVLPVGDPARTDAKAKIFQGAPWFRFPYPFQWGWPTVSIGAVLGVLCGVMTSTIESLGDYYACATISKASIPPTHAMNRGIFVEGFGCVLSGIWGSGNGSTSYSNNIGTISVTKVASRRVIQVAGCIMVFLGLVGKAGAIFVGIPDPIIGGMFCFIFPLVMAVGIGTLAEVTLESSRNIFIVSFSIFMGLAVSQWMDANPGVIKTGASDFDNLLEILLSTGMFVAGMIGFILDNTIHGTPAERGLDKREAEEKLTAVGGDPFYDFPIGMKFIKSVKFFQWIPVSPTYNGRLSELLPFCGNKKSMDVKTEPDNSESVK